MAKYYVEVTKFGTRWYKDEEMKILHREDGPAKEQVNGTKSWWINGQRHRDDGPAIEFADGTKVWYVNDRRHRLDGPAMEHADGYKAWYVNGKFHREDGPAMEHSNGAVQYWLNDKKMTKEQWEAAVRPVEEMTVAQIEQLLGKRIKVIK